MPVGLIRTHGRMGSSGDRVLQRTGSSEPSYLFHTFNLSLQMLLLCWLTDIDELGAAFKLLGFKLRRSEILDLMAEVDADGGECGKSVSTCLNVGVSVSGPKYGSYVQGRCWR